MTNLLTKKCAPCEGSVSPLNPPTVAKYLTEITNWQSVNDKKIIKEFEFKNFSAALDFVNRVGALAETENHHPDILIYNYKKVRIMFSTHAIGGLSENDFIMAAKIDDFN